MVKDALIIAAGRGSRLEDLTDEIPKPLNKLCGLTLIERIMYTASKAGIENFYITVGYKSDELINYLNKKKYPFNIIFVTNDKWQLSNGYSVYCAKQELKNKNFVLLMSDHVFDVNNLKKLISKEPELVNKTVFLACDFKFQNGIDPEDATRVLAKDGLIKNINKNLTEFNAYDTGMFLCSKSFFNYMDELNKVKQSNFSLSDTCNILIKENKFSYCDIEDGFWQDVDTKNDILFAEKKLYNACRKETDGVISKNFNRYISLFITKRIIHLNITPNQMTIFVLLLGILSAFLISALEANFGILNYVVFFIGLLLYKLTSIMDGCDGEISKLKFMSSKLGAWLDTISDNLTTLFFLSAIAYVSLKFEPNSTYIAFFSPFLFSITVLILILKLILGENTGTLVTINKKFSKNPITSLASQLCKRDFFTLGFVVLGSLLMFKTILVLSSAFSILIILSLIVARFKNFNLG